MRDRELSERIRVSFLGVRHAPEFGALLSLQHATHEQRYLVKVCFAGGENEPNSAVSTRAWTLTAADDFIPAGGGNFTGSRFARIYRLASAHRASPYRDPTLLMGL